MQSLTILALCAAINQVDPNWHPAASVVAPPPVAGPVVTTEPVAVIRMQRLAQGPSVLENSGWQANDAASNDAESRPRASWLPKFLRGDYWKRPAEPAEAPRALPPPQPYARRDAAPSDRMLVSRCRALIHDDQQLAGSVIHVTADRGMVTLRGTVSSELLRRRAELVAGKVEGARNIANELVVRQPQGGWRVSAPVTLSAPVRQDGSPLGTRVAPASPVPPVSAPVATLAADSFSLPPAPQRTAADQATSAPAWIPGLPTAAPASSPPLVRLGQPEFLSSRQGLPTVTTFLIRRADDPTTRPVESNSAKPATFSASPAPAANPAPAATTPGRAPASIIQPTARFVVPATPAPVTRASGRTDVDALLSRDPRAARLTYRVTGTELILSGRIASARDLYDLADRLADLPGIGIVGFENLLVGD